MKRLAFCLVPILAATLSCSTALVPGTSFSQPMANLYLGVDWCGAADDSCFPAELRIYQDGHFDFISPSGRFHHGHLSAPEMQALRSRRSSSSIVQAFAMAPDRAPCYHCETLQLFDTSSRAIFAIDGVADLPPAFRDLMSFIDSILGSRLGRSYRQYVAFREGH